MADDLFARGEDRHMRCRYGQLTGAIAIDVEEFRRDQEAGRPLKWEEGGTLPLCYWKPPEPCPPALKRAWGGLVEFERDCAVCQCFEELK